MSIMFNDFTMLLYVSSSSTYSSMVAPVVASLNWSWNDGCCSAFALPTSPHSASILVGLGEVRAGGRTPSGATRQDDIVQVSRVTTTQYGTIMGIGGNCH